MDIIALFFALCLDELVSVITNKIPAFTKFLVAAASGQIITKEQMSTIF